LLVGFAVGAFSGVVSAGAGASEEFGGSGLPVPDGCHPRSAGPGHQERSVAESPDGRIAAGMESVGHALVIDTKHIEGDADREAGMRV
jgi:hypothetical protein